MTALRREIFLKRQAPPMAANDKANILVVDDLPEKLLVLESVLSELGENIVTVRSGEEALRVVLNQEFAVILLDVNMPGMDGLETAAYIRRRKRSAHTPIIFITAFADELHTAQGYSLGAVDYILSPVVPDVLRTKVKVFVDLFRMTQQVRRQADERIALAREQAARAVAEEATQRWTFLAEASAVLTRSLDLQATQRGLLRLVVPALADLAAVTLAGDAGQPWHSELAWVSPLEEVVQFSPLTAADGSDDALRSALETVLATGQHREVRNTETGILNAGAAKLREAVILPLIARGRTLGALTLALGPSERVFAGTDRSLAEDLAARAAVALDNARLYQDIQEVDRRKSDFLAMLAHELRNPLAPMRNSVHLLQMLGLDDPPLQQAREMIDRQVTHMTRLIDDLLDMSRLSRGKILLRKEVVDLVAIVRNTVGDYRSFLEQMNLNIELNLPDEPLYVQGDPTRLSQVVGNILHNARKFTDTGGKVVIGVTEANVDRRSGAGSRDGVADNIAEIRICDNGIGVEPAMLPRMFDSFTQAEGSLDRTRGGLGLGLSLVKGLVELHGGTVHAHSEGLGTGTEIVIRLPLSEAPAAPRPTPAPVEVTNGGRRVLVIEDNPDTAESMRMLLTLTGHDVRLAATGSAGVETARAYQPEVVICDIGLGGGMDGYAVARKLRQAPEVCDALLIASTGYGQEEDQRRCREAGFDVHLTKPVDFGELQRLLSGARAEGK
jgi:signal transduction histidine kinase